MGKPIILLDMIKMGKLNLIISDELDDKFRLEVAKRLGMKKGNLTKAVEEAMALWVESDVIKELEETATSEDTTDLTKDKAINTLAKKGKVSLSALSRISHHPNCTPLSHDKALNRIDEILNIEG